MRWILLLIVLGSCGVPYHMRRAKYHMLQAEAKGAKISKDTTWKFYKIKTEPLHVKFDPKPLFRNDTVYVFEQTTGESVEPIKSTVVVKNDSISTEVDCPEKTVIVRVPVETSTKIEKPPVEVHWRLGAFLIGFIAGILTYGSISKYQSRQNK